MTAGPAAPLSGGKAAFWDNKIASWEASRYSLLSRCNPFSWTVLRRMGAARRLVREDFQHHQFVLDLGCGSGSLAQALLNDPSRSYLGIDFSRTAVEAARRRFRGHAERIRFEQLNVLEAPSLEAPLIVFLGLLDWLDESEMGLLFRKLKAENLCFSFTESESGLGGLLYGRYRRRADKAYGARNFKRAQIEAAAEAGGYRIGRMTRFSPLDPGRLATAYKI